MRVAEIVPAYNEEQTIGTVVEALLQCQIIDELIVVSDGSDDHTVDVASKYPVKVIELKENVGKGGAMKAGASALPVMYCCSLTRIWWASIMSTSRPFWTQYSQGALP